ncbi:MAG: glycoside hydrolase family 18 protein [Myxococcales bacterium]|nr:glycoside hydrolase family 18 protein [Myxococcales bacterium]
MLKRLAFVLTLAPFVGACEPGVAPSEDPQLIEPTPTAVTPPGPPPATPSANDGRWLMAYYVGYERSLLPPADIEWANLTHLAVGAVLPKADGTLDTTYAIDPVKGPAMAKELVDLAHANNKKALVMVGGEGTHDGWVAAAAEKRLPTLVSALVALRKAVGYDGYDLDWEPVPPADEPALLALFRALRAADPGALLTMPVNWLATGTAAVSGVYAKLAPLVDRLNIMTYGMARDWPGWKTWHSSALDGAAPGTPSSVKSSVTAYLAAGVPAAKLGVGAGFYGTCWGGGVSAPGQTVGTSKVLANDHVMSYRAIVEGYLKPGARKWDSVASVPYLGFAAPTGAQKCTFVTYEDEESAAAKAAYVKTAGLGGVIVWTLNQGHLPSRPTGGRNPMMRTLHDGIR